MRKVILCVLLMSIIFFANEAVAGLKKPSIRSQQGQTKAQKEKDTQECHILAAEETGVDLFDLDMRLNHLESMQSYAMMPRGDSLTLSPTRDTQAKEYQAQIDTINEAYDKYLKAFSAAMEARGYKVK